MTCSKLLVMELCCGKMLAYFILRFPKVVFHIIDVFVSGYLTTSSWEIELKIGSTHLISSLGLSMKVPPKHGSKTQSFSLGASL